MNKDDLEIYAEKLINGLHIDDFSIEDSYQQCYFMKNKNEYFVAKIAIKSTWFGLKQVKVYQIVELDDDIYSTTDKRLAFRKYLNASGS